MIQPSAFFSYFNECYKLDYKEFVIENILAQKYSYKWFVKGDEELFKDELPYIPYDNSKTEDLEKDIELYKIDKQLFYAYCFVLGKNNNPLVKDKRICAPLVLFPANIVTVDDFKFLEIDRSSFFLNRSILSKFELKDEKKKKDDFAEEFHEFIHRSNIGDQWIKILLDKYFSNIDTDELLYAPRVWNQKKVKDWYTNSEPDEDSFTIIPAAGTVFVEKSQSSMGVLNDLNLLASNNKFNTGLSCLLNATDEMQDGASSLFKSRLNEQQHQAIKNAGNFVNSLIIGPPGTGKSYTISNLVVDAVVNNRTVLVVSKSKQAVEVIRTMLESEFRLKDYLIHTTGNKFKISLKAKLQRMLSGISSQGKRNIEQSQIRSKYGRLVKAEDDFKDFVQKELKLSDIEFSDEKHFFDQIRKVFLKLGMGNGRRVWELFSVFEKLNASLNDDIKLFCKSKIESNIRKNASLYRKDIATYYDAMDAASFSETKQIAENVNIKHILSVFPVWLANLSDLNEFLPLQQDLFDLVIIDEATQCDIASALPAIYRAKKAVVCGDPNQLRHYSFVSQLQQHTLQKKHGLPKDKMFDYRNRSILDFYLSKVQHQEQVCFLREHFRSTPSLIEFSNQHFYDGQLQVLKSTPKHTQASQIELIQTNGVRNSKGINEVEAEAVFSKLDELIEKYKDDKTVPDIGIISLFSSQVNYLNKLLRERYDIKIIKQFNILCGTPYNFQGNEREIVLISFAVCDQTHHSAYIHANKPEVLNVAITRARSYQYIFKSVSDEKINKDSLLAEYFRFIKEFIHYDNKEIETDLFQNEVVDLLNKKGLKNIQCSYPMGGSVLDILVEKNGKHFFIDLIGYPGMFKEAFTLERYKTLGRMGVTTIPLHYSYWKDNKAEAIQQVLRQINQKKYYSK